MKRWMIGGIVGACLGVAIYLVATKKPAPAPAAAPATSTPAVAIATPVEPIVLKEVVEVTDIDGLLDPPARPVTGEPFDAEPATVSVSIPAAPERIPPAID